MLFKRICAVFLSLLLVWPAAGFSAAGEGFAPAGPPQGMYPVLQEICGRQQLTYRKNGYRFGTQVTYSARTRQTPVEDLALYMNVYIENREADHLDLLEQAGYRQIDIQRYRDGEYDEVRWSFNQFTLQPGWNRLLLRFGERPEESFVPADDRMIVAVANRQTIDWNETANFNFALQGVEEGTCSQYTIIIDNVAIVDTSSQTVNDAQPVTSPYWLLQDLSDALPNGELAFADGGYRAQSAPFVPSAAVKEASRDTMAVYMNLYVENQNLPYHTGLFADDSITRRLTLSDSGGGQASWQGRSFDALDLQPGWNTVVFRLSTGDDVWDGVESQPTQGEILSLSGTLQLSFALEGLDAAYDRYRIQIARVALVDVSRRTDGDAFYDTSYEVLRFSDGEKTYSATSGPLSTGWVCADGTTPDTGADISRHNRSGLRLMMTMTLEAQDVSQPEEDWFAQGTLYLRATDGEDGGERGGVWDMGPLKLKEGTNLLSLKLTDLSAWGESRELDYTAVNRLQIELEQPEGGTVRMTLEDIQIVDVAGRRPGDAAIATLSEGMDADDAVVYNLNAAEWGADPTGESDSTTAIQDCLDTLRTDGGVVFLPAGRYRIAGNLNLPAGVTLRGEWQNPNEGGAGKGTILMAYASAGQEEAAPFIQMRSSACLRDISVWYPEQDPVDPVPYPPTIEGQGHTVVKNVTLYNAYTGFYNDSCSSMLIRDFYATALSQGIYGANAYDIPRIEKVSIDTRYWIQSGLPGAPSGLQADQLNSYARQYVTGLTGGRQDWGYWYDIEICNAKTGIFLFAGNDAVGKLRTENVQYGIYTTNVNAPGLQITHSDISATEECVHYEVDARQTLVASATTFRDAQVGIHTVSTTPHGVILNDCTFLGWDSHAVYMQGGHLTAANNRFEEEKPAILLKEEVGQALLTGNAFGAPDQAVTTFGDTLLVRDDGDTSVPGIPDYAFSWGPQYRPAGDSLFLVTDYGAQAGGEQDCTAAFQAALDDAGQAGGGTVYIPGGTYRLDGSLTIPSGVELRGSFDGAHYGNSTFNGTQLYVYGGKDDSTAEPLFTLGESSGVKGFTVFYPEQGISDQVQEEADRVHTYPYVVRMDRGCWVENVAMVNAYCGIDAITNRCDGMVVRDVTGYTMKEALQVGHGLQGGTIHNFHLNPSGWTQQGGYENRPTGTMPDGETSRSDLFEDYATRESTYLTLGDCRDLEIFSSFDIVIAAQMRLIADPYTGGSFQGTTWGIAFDASRNGIVGEEGCDARLVMLAAMGVFNQQGGGYNVVTAPGFTGEITLYNADAWGGGSQIALVEGGRVSFVQYFSMSAYKGICREGGELNFYNSVLVSRDGDNSGYTPDLTYEPGSRGAVVGNLDCSEILNVNIEPGARVEERFNGQRLQPAEAAMTFSGTQGTFTPQEGTADTGWVRWDGKADGFDLAGRNQRNMRLWLTIETKEAAEATISLCSPLPEGEEQPLTASWTLSLQEGENRLSLPVEELLDSPAALDRSRVSYIRVQVAAEQPVTLSAAQLTDLTSIYQQKQRLFAELLAQPQDTQGCRVSDIQAYEAAFGAAQGVYADERAGLADIAAAYNALQQAAAQLVPVDKEALRELVREAGQLEADDYTPESYAPLAAQLAQAEDVLADGDATQQEVDAAVQALNEAMEGLLPVPSRQAGDVDGNGDIAASDALLALQAATQKIELDSEQQLAADMDQSGEVTSSDALLILQIATQKIAQE